MKKFARYFLIFSGLFVFAACKKDGPSEPVANAPTIIAFMPDKGGPGTVVTVTGTNFSADIASNTLSFNGIVATISSATTTQLVAKVAAGTTTGKITVKVNTNTATSSTDFLVTSSSSNRLSLGRTFFGLAMLDGKIFIGGGHNETAGGTQKLVDIYDTLSKNWSTAQLSVAREYVAAGAAGSKIVFAGGQTDHFDLESFSDAVDIYDAQTNTWTTSFLDVPRAALQTASVGNKVVFAGGITRSPVLTTVQMYDVTTGSWSSHELAGTTVRVAMASAGNKLLIAGRESDETLSPVDIYDVTTDTWTVAHLTDKRVETRAVVLGNKIIFAGGFTSYGPDLEFREYSKIVDIYDVTTGTWTALEMNEARYYPRPVSSSAGAGNTAIFSRGYNLDVNGNGEITDEVDIFNLDTNTWTVGHLSKDRSNAQGIGFGNTIWFIGGANTDKEGFYDTIDSYNVITGQWSN